VDPDAQYTQTAHGRGASRLECTVET
jgi:hypothetical protein